LVIYIRRIQTFLPDPEFPSPVPDRTLHLNLKFCEKSSLIAAVNYFHTKNLNFGEKMLRWMVEKIGWFISLVWIPIQPFSSHGLIQMGSEMDQFRQSLTLNTPL
jgi:hypothetical protein